MEVYLVTLTTQSRKENHYFLYDDKEIAKKAVQFYSGDMYENDMYFEEFTNNEENVKELISFTKIKDLLKYLKKNNMIISEEFEGTWAL